MVDEQLLFVSPGNLAKEDIIVMCFKVRLS